MQYLEVKMIVTKDGSTKKGVITQTLEFDEGKALRLTQKAIIDAMFDLGDQADALAAAPKA